MTADPTDASTPSTVRGLSLTSLVDMFLPALYTCNDKIVARMCRAHLGGCPACGWLEEKFK